VAFDVTVTAVDPFNHVAVGYTGTVTFGTSDPDPGVVLPADYAFTLADGGSHTFTDTGLGETSPSHQADPGDRTCLPCALLGGAPAGRLVGCAPLSAP
jgi:hypothetical protein